MKFRGGTTRAHRAASSRAAAKLQLAQGVSPGSSGKKSRAAAAATQFRQTVGKSHNNKAPSAAERISFCTTERSWHSPPALTVDCGTASFFAALSADEC